MLEGMSEIKGEIASKESAQVWGKFKNNFSKNQ